MQVERYEKPAISAVIPDPGGEVEERAVSSWILVGTAAVAAATWIVATTRVRKRVRHVRTVRTVRTGQDRLWTELDDGTEDLGLVPAGEEAEQGMAEADADADESPLTVVTISGRR